MEREKGHDCCTATHMNVQESVGNSLVPRPSCLQFLISAVCNQKLEAGRPGNEAKRGALGNLWKEREENGVEEKGKGEWRRGKKEKKKVDVGGEK